MNPLLPEEIRLLTETGFLAAAQGDLPGAAAIFDALRICRPEAHYTYVGMAMAQLNRRRHDDALRTLEQGLASADASHAGDLHAMRALVLRLAGRASEATRALRAAGDHALAHALAADGA